MKEYVYKCKDGRYRLVYVDDDGRHSSKSYPRVLMERKLGRSLLPTEDVHHIDGNKDNNDINNLEVVDWLEHRKHHGKSQIKFADKLAICDVCGKQFMWTSERQRRYYGDLHRGKCRIISCSWECSSRYGRWKQLGKV